MKWGESFHWREFGELDWVRLQDLGFRSLGMSDRYDSVMDSPGWCLSELGRPRPMTRNEEIMWYVLARIAACPNRRSGRRHGHGSRHTRV